MGGKDCDDAPSLAGGDVEPAGRKASPPPEFFRVGLGRISVSEVSREGVVNTLDGFPPPRTIVVIAVAVIKNVARVETIEATVVVVGPAKGTQEAPSVELESEVEVVTWYEDGLGVVELYAA